MKIVHFIRWIKNNWKDPVWSKVFAAGIISLITTIGIFIWSLIKQVPFLRIIYYLKNTNVEMSLFSISIVSLFFLATLIPMLYFRIIIFQSKNRKIPVTLKYNKIPLETLLNGKWTCEYYNTLTKDQGKETLLIVKGNNYYLRGSLYFILTDMNYDALMSQIIWTKTQYPGDTKHSTETLNIKNERELTGVDDIGYTIKYTKVSI